MAKLRLAQAQAAVRIACARCFVRARSPRARGDLLLKPCRQGATAWPEITVEKVFGTEALLIDVPGVARALGFSVFQARRFLATPPAGFPPLVRVGARIFVRRPQLEAWARGEVIAAPVAPAALQPEPARRPRGRPRKSEVASREPHHA